MSGVHVSTTINGDPVEFVCTADEPLLDVLRNRLGLTGAKEGCGTGDCGACRSIRPPRVSCLVLVPNQEPKSKPSKAFERRPAASLQKNFISLPPFNAASAPRASWWQPRRCSIRIPIHPKRKSALALRAIFAAAPVTTRLSAPFRPLPKK